MTLRDLKNMSFTERCKLAHVDPGKVKWFKYQLDIMDQIGSRLPIDRMLAREAGDPGASPGESTIPPETAGTRRLILDETSDA